MSRTSSRTGGDGIISSDSKVALNDDVVDEPLIVAVGERDGTETVHPTGNASVCCCFSLSNARRTCICFDTFDASSSEKPAARIACGIRRNDAASLSDAAFFAIFFRSLSIVDRFKIDILVVAVISIWLSRQYSISNTGG